MQASKHTVTELNPTMEVVTPTEYYALPVVEVEPRTSEYAGDERKGWPSASSIGRVIECPGSFLFESQFPREEKKKDEAAVRGTIMHEVLAGVRSMAELSGFEQWIVKVCRSTEAQYVSELHLDHEGVKVISETRMWYREGKAAINFSDKLDKAYWDPSSATALLLDYKTGRKEVEMADDNWQIGASIVNLFRRLPELEQVYAAVIQPLNPGENPLTLYRREHITAMEAQLEESLALSLSADAPRAAGKHCERCKAKPSCKEAQDMSLAVLPPGTSLVKQGRKNVLSYPTPSVDQLQVILPQLPVMKKFAEEISDVAKEMLVTDPDSISGWAVTAGYELVNLTPDANAPSLLKLLEPHGFTFEDLWAIASFNVSDLRTMIGNKLGLLEEDSQKQALKGLLSPALAIGWGGRQLKAARKEDSK